MEFDTLTDITSHNFVPGDIDATVALDFWLVQAKPADALKALSHEHKCHGRPSATKKDLRNRIARARAQYGI